MKLLLNKLFSQERLTKEEAKQVLTDIAANKYNDAQIASFLTVFKMRPVAIEEFEGFKEALAELALKVDFSEFETIDLCGTGGDGKNTFNISTITSFVVAGAGKKVAKHGNYGVSSVSGSSNVMEYFGYKFTNDESKLKRELDRANICFLHAPLFHSSMKAVGPTRRSLGVKTFFNMLGPLVNPSNTQNQLVGVYDLEVARIYNYLLQNSEKNYGIVFTLDGYDEISLTTSFKYLSREKELLIKPEDIGFKRLQQNDIFGGNSVEEAASIFKKILEGEGTDKQNSVVIANAAMAIQLMNGDDSIETAKEVAKDSLLGLKAKQAFKNLINL